MAVEYRVALIGSTGRGNYGHGIDAVWAEVPQTKVVAVADDDPAGLAETANRLGVQQTYADYRTMLDETPCEIVAIGPRWIDRHAEMCLAAAERGRHIFMEKPFCRNLEEADQIIAACERTHSRLALSHQTRYSPRLRVVQELIAAGRIGRVLEFRARGKEDGRGGGEDLWVLGSHILNLVQTLGGDPQWCAARVLQQGEPVARQHVGAGNEGIGPLAGDHVQAMYGLSGGATAYFGSQRGAGGSPSRFGVQIFGSQGVLEIGTGYLPYVKLLEDPSWSPGRSGTSWQDVTSAGVGQSEPLADTGLHGGNVLAVQDLIAAIEAGREPLCGMYAGRWTVEMIAAVFESHRLGQTVALPLQTRVNPLSLL